MGIADWRARRWACGQKMTFGTMAIRFTLSDRRKLRRIISVVLMVMAMGAAGAWVQYSRPSPLYLGFIGPLAGGYGDVGQAARNGTILAIEECNNDGGIEDHPVELLIDDESAGTSRIADFLSTMARKHAPATVGPMTSEGALFASIESQRNGIVLFSPTAGPDELTGRDDLFFHLYPSCTQLMDQLARYMYSWRRLARPAVIVDDSLGNFGLQMAGDFAKAYALSVSEPVRIIRYSSASEGPFRDTAQRAASVNPDSILILAGPQQTAMLCQYLKRAGCNVPVAATELAASDELVAYGGSAVEGLFFYHSFDRYYPSERYESFRLRFRRRFGRESTFAAVHAYDAARILLTAIAEKHPKTDIRQALSEMRFFEGVQGRIAISGTGDVHRELFLSTVRNGAFRAMD